MAQETQNQTEAEAQGREESELNDLLANGFFPMESAPKDGRDIQIVFRHFNWRYADKEDRGEWQQLCTARWTTFNNGGWVWNGLCGVPICWRPLANAKLTGGPSGPSS